MVEGHGMHLMLTFTFILIVIALTHVVAFRECNCVSSECEQLTTNSTDIECKECAVGRFNPQNCQQRCGHCQYDVICDSVDGSCPFGCKNGYSGRSCDVRVCPRGTFSPPDCKRKCKCLDEDGCHPIDGNCRGGRCQKGYWGPDCQGDESKKAKCDMRDPKCVPPGMSRCWCSDPDCDLDEGECRPGPCPRGLKGPRCDVAVCPIQRYGPPECRQECHCATGFCDLINGTCSDGVCMEGWGGGPACDTPVCPPQHFGYPECKSLCFCGSGLHCDDAGKCESGCRIGWTGDHCNVRMCPEDKFGLGNASHPACTNTCHCLTEGNADCNSRDGFCELGQCQHGWAARDCSLDIAGSPGSSQQRGRYIIPGPLVVLLVVGVVVGSVAVAGVVMWKSAKYRRLRQAEEMDRIIDGFGDVRRGDEEQGSLELEEVGDDRGNATTAAADNDDVRRGNMAVTRV